MKDYEIEEQRQFADDIFDCHEALEGIDFAYHSYDEGDHFMRLSKALMAKGYHKTEVKTNGDFFRSISGAITDEQFANDNVEVVRSVKGGELFIARVVGEVFNTKNEAYQANLEWLKREYKGE